MTERNPLDGEDIVGGFVLAALGWIAGGLVVIGGLAWWIWG